MSAESFPITPSIVVASRVLHAYTWTAGCSEVAAVTDKATRGVTVAVGTVSFTLTAEMTSHRAGHLLVTREWSVRVVDVIHTPLFSNV